MDSVEAFGFSIPRNETTFVNAPFAKTLKITVQKLELIGKKIGISIEVKKQVFCYYCIWEFKFYLSSKIILIYKTTKIINE